MQRVRLDAMLSGWFGGDGQLLVTVIEILLREIELRELEHLGPNRGGRAVGGDHDAGLGERLGACIFIAQAQGAGF